MSVSRNYAQLLSTFHRPNSRAGGRHKCTSLMGSKTFASKSDVAIELPTGAGKTLIALRLSISIVLPQRDEPKRTGRTAGPRIRWGVTVIASGLASLGLLLASGCSAQDNQATYRDLATPTAKAIIQAIASPKAESCPTPKPSPTPERDYVEESLKAGKIEIREGDLALVSPKEARELLAQAKARGDFRFVLPFIPQGGEILQNYVLTNSLGMSFTYLGVRNASEATTFYSSTDGKALVGQAGNKVDGKFVATQSNITISDSEMQVTTSAPLDIRLYPPFSEQKVVKEVNISMGDRVFSPALYTLERNGQKYNFILYIARGPNIQQLSGIMLKSDDPEDLKKLEFSGASLGNLLRKNGKVVIVTNAGDWMVD